MGEIDIFTELMKDNPHARRSDIVVFSDAMGVYIEASVNIRKNGAVVAHPRTGAPIENPYLKIQRNSGQTMTSMKKIKTNRVMQLIEKEEIKRHADS